jgi:RNA polymerase-binding transcription factor DksA
MEDAGVRGLLSAERESTLARIGSMIGDFEEIVAATEGSNSDDEHDPEGSTIAYERAQIAALLLEARTHLDDLDRALARLDAGDYARCEQCGTLIPPERLAARPATRTCIECATAPHRVTGDQELSR